MWSGGKSKDATEANSHTWRSPDSMTRGLRKLSAVPTQFCTKLEWPSSLPHINLTEYPEHSCSSQLYQPTENEGDMPLNATGILSRIPVEKKRALGTTKETWREIRTCINIGCNNVPYSCGMLLTGATAARYMRILYCLGNFSAYLKLLKLKVCYFKSIPYSRDPWIERNRER